MKKSKGFTLIELLAVIVILAIIALIVTPVVSGIITSARNSANARSVEGHIRNVELAIVTDAFATGSGDLAIYDRTNGALPSGLTIPTNDKITCKKYTISNGQVVEATKCANKSDTANWHKTYKYTASNGAEVDGELGEKAFTVVAAQSGETHKGIVYMDPTDLDAKCDANSTITTTNTGCKKFYIFDEDNTNNTYKMLMDRNTTAKVAGINKDDFIEAGGAEADWNLMRYNSQGPVTANKQLANDTVNWIGNPRLITSDEVAHIVGADSENTIKWSSSKNYNTGNNINTNNNISYYYLDGGRNSNPTIYDSSNNGWQKKYAKSRGTSNYSWLYDYTFNCRSNGCNTEDNSTNGYWTNDTSAYSSIYAICSEGTLNTFTSNRSDYNGIRPVLEISKDLID